MKNRKYILFKKAYSTTLENTIEIKTDMQKEYETYRVEYTVQWSTLLPYKGMHDRLIRMLLLLLRKAWVGDWEQPINSHYGVIYIEDNEFKVDLNFTIRRTLSFPTKKMAEDFLSCFKDLCETAKILL